MKLLYDTNIIEKILGLSAITIVTKVNLLMLNSIYICVLNIMPVGAYCASIILLIHTCYAQNYASILINYLLLLRTLIQVKSYNPKEKRVSLILQLSRNSLYKVIIIYYISCALQVQVHSIF